MDIHPTPSPPRPLRIGSLCSGSGALDLAVREVLGGRITWHAETDKAAASVLAAHWPEPPNHGDLTSLDWNEVEGVDMITAGFPCQPISNAGKRKGTEDDRWIWPHIVEGIRLLRPSFVLLENVSAILRRGFDAVADSLAESGYDLAWTCLRASDVGAAHQRNRWFALAWPSDPDDYRCEWARSPRDGRPGSADGDSAAADAGRDPRPQDHENLDAPGRSGDAPTDAARLGERGPAVQTDPEPARREAREVASGRGLLAPTPADAPGLRHRNGRTPAGEGIPAAAVGGADPDPAGDGRHEGLTQSARLGRGLDAPELGGTDWGKYGPAVVRWSEVIGRQPPAPTEPGKNGPRLSPRFVEWLMGYEPGHVTGRGLARTAELRILGNGVVPQQAASALRGLLKVAPPKLLAQFS
ncbi:DNA cytosine methyltransferase [Glycomyces buryatensis]|uniref:DNA (cytosine-5-)-methyltransferase n=1 Tax=Glycomyces buryatensis TaxID=2570927 RepID=A0A4S8Q5P4_9ACTN|nr:DNA cytosine methyltransferase [Glycomyces buryatensis]